jgi:RNA polymerase sigma factor (sigma-70 family)
MRKARADRISDSFFGGGFPVFGAPPECPRRDAAAEGPPGKMSHTVTTPVHRLTRYHRDARIEAEIERLRGARLEALSREVEGGPCSPETMVCLIRERSAAGDEDGAWALMMQLLKRCEKSIKRNCFSWQGLSPYQREEAEEAILCALFTEWRSLAPEHEFWEVRFALVLKRKTLDELSRQARVVANETTLSPQDDGDGSALDPWETFVDLRDLGPEARALIGAALGQLPEHERKALMLHQYFRWTEEEIAEHLKVTSRSVRNYLTRAKERLRAWRDSH